MAEGRGNAPHTVSGTISLAKSPRGLSRFTFQKCPRLDSHRDLIGFEPIFSALEYAGEISAREEIRTLTERFLGSLSLLIGLREQKWSHQSDMHRPSLLTEQEYRFLMPWRQKLATGLGFAPRFHRFKVCCPTLDDPVINGRPDRNRTCKLRVRSALLWSVELRVWESGTSRTIFTLISLVRSEGLYN